MKKLLIMFFGFSLIMIAFAQQDVGKYIKKPAYPVLDELEAIRDKNQAYNDSITAAIRARQEEQQEIKDDEETVFHADFSSVKKPKSLESFKQYFHLPPVAQYESGMCWCFSTTSFIESEVYRKTGQQIKLSELHTVYYEYLAKALRYIQERGDSEFGEGSEANAVFRIMESYGAVPAEVYTGLPYSDRHDHTVMFKEMEDYLKYCNDHNYWNEETAIASISVILNHHLGEPPLSFEYAGQTMTPIEFYRDILQFNPADYVEFMSNKSIDFYTKGKFDVPDNWWLDENYYNLPLDEWYAILKKALKNGITVPIGGDVSEPGYAGAEDAAFIPDFDIPQKYINQDSRELRIYNKATEDDHGVHIVGYTRIGDYDWYLVKDSARGSRQGQFEGYYFYRDDYIRLKMLTFTVPRDFVKDVLKKFGR